MTKAFNPPPHWPEPPRPGWIPPQGWRPDRSWGAIPAGWRLWSDRSRTPVGPAPLAESEDIPASGVRVPPATTDYPVSVTLPGRTTEHPAPPDLHGFDPAPERRDRPRLRRALTLTTALLGLLVAAATALLFVRIVEYAQEDLPTRSLGAVSISSAAERGPADA